MIDAVWLLAAVAFFGFTSLAIQGIGRLLTED